MMHRVIAGLAVAVVLSAPTAQAKQKVDPCQVARCATQASINASCPCGKSGHGSYSKCYVKAVKALTGAGKIPAKCVGEILDCGSSSTCGRPGYVVCDIPTAGCRVLPTTASCNFANGTVRVGATSCCTSCSTP